MRGATSVCSIKLLSTQRWRKHFFFFFRLLIARFRRFGRVIKNKIVCHVYFNDDSIIILISTTSGIKNRIQI
jgi:IS4 transposase